MGNNCTVSASTGWFCCLLRGARDDDGVGRGPVATGRAVGRRARRRALERSRRPGRAAPAEQSRARHAAQARGFRSRDPWRRVFDRDGVGCLKPEPPEREQVALRIRFASRHVLGRDDHLEDVEARRPQHHVDLGAHGPRHDGEPRPSGRSEYRFSHVARDGRAVSGALPKELDTALQYLGGRWMQRDRQELRPPSAAGPRSELTSRSRRCRPPKAGASKHGRIVDKPAIGIGMYLLVRG